MSDFRIPQSDSNPLDLLFKLQALKQNRDATEIEARRDALRTVLQVQAAGGDPSALLDRLNDPALSQSLQSATDAQRAERERAAFANRTNPAAVAPFAQAAAPIVDATGNVTPPPEEEAARARGNYIAALNASGVTDQASQAAALAVYDSTVAAQGRAAQETIAGEKRRFGQQEALSRRADARADASAHRAEARQIAAEQRAMTATDADEFTVNAANVALADPSRQPDLVKMATERFGPEAARRFEYRLANLTEAGSAKLQLDKNALRLKEADALAQGKTADKRMARLASEGKAGYDPTTGFYYIGQDAATEQRMSTLSSLYEIREQFEAAAEMFARESGGKTFTGTIEELKGKVGSQNPYFSAMQLLQTKYEDNLAYFKSGANISANEKESADRINPKYAAINVSNNTLNPSTRVQFSGQREELESLYLQRFSQADRAAVRAALRDNAKGRLAELESDQSGWLRQLTAPTTRGSEVLQSIRDAASQSQPGGR